MSQKDELVQCPRCRNKHKYSERVDKPSKALSVFVDIVCPRCGCKSYYSIPEKKNKSNNQL